MKYTITNYGSKLFVDPVNNPFTHELLLGAASCYKAEEERSQTTLSNILETLYYEVDFGYYGHANIRLDPIIALNGNTAPIIVYIPSPALVDIYSAQAAVQALEAYCQAEDLITEELDDAAFKEAYETLCAEADDAEDTDDEQDVIEEDSTDSYQENTKALSSIEHEIEPEQDQIVSGEIRTFYRLNKASDMYKYKKAAKSFYQVGNNYFMDVKPQVIIQNDFLKLQDVNMKYAKKIPLKNIR